MRIDNAGNISLEIEQTIPKILTLRNPNRYLVEGWVVGPARLKSARILIGGKIFSSLDIELHRPDIQINRFPRKRTFHTIFCGFSIPVVIEPVSDEQDLDAVIELRFRDGTLFTQNIWKVLIYPWRSSASSYEIPNRLDHENLLAICMATYNPTPLPFRRQIESILAQHHQNWICIICDDNSTETAKTLIREAVAQDDRFFFVENDVNVGFYANFERCLDMVPSCVKYIALSDQDDIWYQDKLTRTLEAFHAETMLVYCDMKIVDCDRNVLFPTYWTSRKNYYRSCDIDLLTIANTVTGAAAVFKRELLDLALPFPPRYGEVFHDQWLAILAAGSGGIEYIDTPLYEYVQYGNNVIGHTDFSHQTYLQYVLNYFTASPLRNKSVLNVIGQVTRATLGMPSYAWHVSQLRHGTAKHVTTLAETALLRNLTSESKRLIGSTLSVQGLTKIHLKVARNQETLNGLELLLLFGDICQAIFRWLTPIFTLYVGSRLERWVHSRRRQPSQSTTDL